SELGKEVESIMQKGELVPDSVVIEMIANRIDKNPGSAGFLFDGFPRTADQAVALDNMLEGKGTSVNKMIVLEVEHDELVKRLLSRAEVSGRADDQNVDVIENRISVYKEKTEPVVNYYRIRDKYVSVNGTGQISEIFNRLSDVIAGR
ncbi:MAG: nucleoside monophosphate kinase, partial [Bacteroidales bacterium]|nr:nucleoside monophosphate kinase [Bacteroidales bacterium]